jgi:hypothetical protein
MKTTAFLTLLASVLMISVTSCKYSDKDDKGGISTDLINNANTAGEYDPDNAAEISFEVLKYDFGAITQGEIVAYTYRFKNSGVAPLIISNVQPSCGCTDLKTWPQEPIAPGETGEISVEFNSEGRSGSVNKSISVVSNTSPATIRLGLSGEIVTPD